MGKYRIEYRQKNEHNAFRPTLYTYSFFQATEEHFKELKAEEKSRIDIQFKTKRSAISLDIPEPGVLTIGEWTLHLNAVPCSVGANFSLPGCAHITWNISLTYR